MNNSNINELNKTKSVNNKKRQKCFNIFLENLNTRLVHCTKSNNEIASSIVQAITSKDMKTLNKLCENGLPDDLQILRAYVWKIILGYLPIDYNNWDETFSQKRKQYETYKSLIKDKLKKELDEKDYKSKEVLEQIIKDVYRTNVQLSFFVQSTDKSKTFNNEELLKILNKRKNWDFSNINEIYKYDNIENETHSDVLTRILFTYSFLAKDVSYHQGMNEILAPIYYCYSYDKLYIEEKEVDIEADSFWSFYYLMNEIKRNFNTEQEGLFLKSKILGECLKIINEKVYINLEEKNVKNEYFSFRWFMMLFSQDFNIGDILKLWDFIFCGEKKNYFVFYVSLGILEYRKDKIINGDMAEIIQCLQDLGDILCDDLVYIARELKKKYGNKIDPIIAKSE
jgi:hypothetical protein